MGLDVYVGPFTRYYSGDWETVVAQAAREAGAEFTVIRPGMTSEDPEVQKLIDELGPTEGAGTEEALTDPAEITEAVLSWRSALSEALDHRLDWVEHASAQYFTDKPAWDGYGSLQVLAASVEREERKLPKTGVEDWTKSKVWRKAADGASPRFPHLYYPELWFPVDLDFTFEADDAGGNRVTMGSSVRLLAELRSVNDATFAGTDSELAQWRFDGTDYGGPFERTARFGLAVFLELAAKSVEERLPMRLDY